MLVGWRDVSPWLMWVVVAVAGRMSSWGVRNPMGSGCVGPVVLVVQRQPGRFAGWLEGIT